MKDMKNKGFDIITVTALDGFCADLEDYGVNEYVQELGFKPQACCFLVEFPDFVHLHEEISDEYLDRKYLNLRGFETESNWSSAMFRGLINSLERVGIESYLMLLTYTSPPETGVRCVWVDEHQELFQTDNNNERLWAEPINPLKRFKDGTYYDAFFSNKLEKVLSDYGFHGFFLGDGLLGLRGPNETLEHTDYSEDMMLQFKDYLASFGKVYPALANISAMSVPERAGLIWEHYRAKWQEFYAYRWKAFYERLSTALRTSGKKIIALDAWARGPQDAYYDFGVDYGELYRAGLDTVVVQSHEAVKNRKHLEGWHTAESSMKLNILALKAECPEIKVLFSTCTIGRSELWNSLHECPKLLERELKCYQSLRIVKDNQVSACVDGTWVLEGYQLPRPEWNWLYHIWNQKSVFDMDEGFRLLWCENALCSYRTKGRRYDLLKQLSWLVTDGLPVHSAESIESTSGTGIGYVGVCLENIQESERGRLKTIAEDRTTAVLLIGTTDKKLFAELFSGIDPSALTESDENFASWRKNGRNKETIRNARIELLGQCVVYRAVIGEDKKFCMILDNERKILYLNTGYLPMELSQMAVNAANQLLNRGISIDNYQNYAIPQKDSFYLCVENPENPFYANATIQWNSDQVRPVVNPYVRRETVSQNSLVLVVPPDGMTELEFERCKK